MGNFVAGFIVFIALAGMGCILYDLIFVKDTYPATIVSHRTNINNNNTKSVSFINTDETGGIILEDET